MYYETLIDAVANAYRMSKEHNTLICVTKLWSAECYQLTFGFVEKPIVKYLFGIKQ